MRLFGRQNHPRSPPHAPPRLPTRSHATSHLPARFARPIPSLFPPTSPPHPRRPSDPPWPPLARGGQPIFKSPGGGQAPLAPPGRGVPENTGLRRRRRAATETVDDRIRGPKSGRVQCRYSLQKPVFKRLFRVLTVFSSIDLVQKCSVIFLMTANKHRTEFWPDRRIAGPDFRPRKRLYSRK